MWYTYWSGGEYTKNSQTFTICGGKTFTYKELKYNLDLCMHEVKLDEGPHALEEDIEELKVYVNRFLHDMDNYFKFPNNIKNFLAHLYAMHNIWACKWILWVWNIPQKIRRKRMSKRIELIRQMVNANKIEKDLIEKFY
jgi:hypothetical protein